MKITTIIVVMFCLCLGVPIPGDAGMTSANYRITTTVVSGGGGPMASASYGLNGTVGQPSPLIDPFDPPWSTSYDLLTGFWYTLDAGLEGCRWDIEPEPGDGDVDGADLAEFLNAFDPMNLAAFAAQFGRNDCF
jgi:hypothetical protein